MKANEQTNREKSFWWYEAGWGLKGWRTGAVMSLSLSDWALIDAWIFFPAQSGLFFARDKSKRREDVTFGCFSVGWNVDSDLGEEKIRKTEILSAYQCDWHVYWMCVPLDTRNHSEFLEVFVCQVNCESLDLRRFDRIWLQFERWCCQIKSNAAAKRQSDEKSCGISSVINNFRFTVSVWNAHMLPLPFHSYISLRKWKHKYELPQIKSIRKLSRYRMMKGSEWEAINQPYDWRFLFHPKE